MGDRSFVTSGSALRVCSEDNGTPGVILYVELPGEPMVVRFEDREVVENLMTSLRKVMDEVWPLKEVTENSIHKDEHSLPPSSEVPVAQKA